MTTAPTEIIETTQAILATTEGTEPVIDVESIKELMDGFDPASLLPPMEELLGSLEPVCRWAVMLAPVIMLALGLAYLFLAPKEANYYFGYRCYFGMGSVMAWRFTQRFAGLLLGLAGLVQTIVMYFISQGFAGMEVSAMVWRAVSCLAWEAGIAIAVTLIINITAAVLFTRKGEPRQKRKFQGKESPQRKEKQG